MNQVLNNLNMAGLTIFMITKAFTHQLIKSKLAFSTLETDKANLGGVSTTLPKALLLPIWLVMHKLIMD